MISFDAGEYGIQISNALCEHADVLLIAFDFIEAEIDHLDARVERFLIPRPRMRAAHEALFRMAALRRKLAQWQPDVVHVQHHFLWFNFLYPTLRRYPTVITVHDPVHHLGDGESNKTPQGLTHWGYRQGDEWITHAAALKEILVGEVRLPAERITVIPHIAHWKPFPGTDISEKGRKILFFGRIWEYKGLEYLIRAEPLVTDHFPDVEFVIAGRGEDFDRYRRMMVNPDRFTVDNSWIDDPTIDRYFAESAIVALPYVDASQSGVVSIAYAYGKPVVATTVGGLPDVVDEGVTGVLVPPRDVDTLAKAIIGLLDDDELRRRMGAAARAKLDREWAPEVVGPAHMAVYEQLLARKRGAPRKAR